MNVFEGARRVKVLIAFVVGVVAIGASAFYSNGSPKPLWLLTGEDKEKIDQIARFGELRQPYADDMIYVVSWFGTYDKVKASEVDGIIARGGRVLTSQETRRKKVEEARLELNKITEWGFGNDEFLLGLMCSAWAFAFVLRLLILKVDRSRGSTMANAISIGWLFISLLFLVGAKPALVSIGMVAGAVGAWLGFAHLVGWVARGFAGKTARQ